MSFFQHGETEAIWAATSFEGACLHMLHADRHKTQIEAANMRIIVIEIAESSLQHKQFGQFHLWKNGWVPHSAGLFCTAPYGGKGSNVTVGHKMVGQFVCQPGITIHPVQLN